MLPHPSKPWLWLLIPLSALAFLGGAYLFFYRGSYDAPTTVRVPFEEIDVSGGNEKWELAERTGWRTVPQIFINDTMIGGYEELHHLNETGELDRMLKE